MKTEFNQRHIVPVIKLWQFLFCCRKKHKKLLNQHKRHHKLIESEFDLLRILKKQRQHEIFIKSLFTKSQRYLGKKLAEKVINKISDKSTVSEDTSIDFLEISSKKSKNLTNQFIKQVNKQIVLKVKSKKLGYRKETIENILSQL